MNRALKVTFVHTQVKLANFLRKVRWHCPPHTRFEIQTLEIDLTVIAQMTAVVIASVAWFTTSVAGCDLQLLSSSGG